MIRRNPDRSVPFLAILAFAFLVGPTMARAEKTARVTASPPTLVVPLAPDVYKTGNRNALCYELHLANMENFDADLSRVDILADHEGGTILRSYEGKALERNLLDPSRGIPDHALLIWIGLPGRDPVPDALYHRVQFTTPGSGEVITIQGALTPVNKATAPIVAPPLRGEGWYAGEGASYPMSHHRRALINFQGVSSISQRFGFDFSQIGPNGLLYKSNGSTNEDFHCYGKDILAVADGVVTDARDGVPENTPFWVPDPDPSVFGAEITLLTAPGNHVIVKFGEDRYAFYAHMIPGTVTVRIGDQVSAGQVLGKLGNSGNSTGPHLHFHIANTADFFRAEGIAYLFDAYIQQGIRTQGSDAPWFPEPDRAIPRVNEMPLDGTVITFPER